jgi:NAD-dependent dihydropyrimidine dehydrogenase PreA subunit
MVTIAVDAEKCNGCGACVDACNRRVLEIRNNLCVPLRPEMCRFCMLCVSACDLKLLKVII